MKTLFKNYLLFIAFGYQLLTLPQCHLVLGCWIVWVKGDAVMMGMGRKNLISGLAYLSLTMLYDHYCMNVLSCL
jgi:hypothetical protein